MDDVQTISKTSNSPQRCVQSTAEMTSRSEKAEIEYIGSVQMTAAMNWINKCKVSYTGLTDGPAPVEPVITG